jgi:hypothetical protein
MPRTAGQVWVAVAQALEDATARLSSKVPGPIPTSLASGHKAFRYAEKTVEQAILLKLIRTLSALRAAHMLIDGGLILDAGASMRIRDELGSDIMFLAGPLVTSVPAEPRHAQYLQEFFQEEFDHPDPLRSTQSRRRVSRRDIRAYVARAFSAGLPVADIIAVSETIDHAFSGYVHGAGAHIMDVYDGQSFRVPMSPSDPPTVTVRDQFAQYLHRAIMNATIAASAIGDSALAGELYHRTVDYFDPEGGIL